MKATGILGGPQALLALKGAYPEVFTAKGVTNAKRGLEMVISKVRGSNKRQKVTVKPKKTARDKKKTKTIKKRKDKLKKTIRRVIEADKTKHESLAKCIYIKGKVFPWPASHNQMQIAIFNDAAIDFNWFSPSRLMDQLALAFKAKVGVVTGGNTSATLTGNFDTDTKFTLVSGLVEQEVTNNFPVPIHLTWYEFRPKVNVLTQSLNAYATWNESIAAKKMILPGTAAFSVATAEFMYDDPRSYARMRERYHITANKHYMQPGGIAHLTLKSGLKHYNAQTFKNVNADTAYLYQQKGRGVETIMVYYPVLSEANPTQALPFEPLRQIKTGAAVANETSLLWQVREVLKFRMPSETADANEHGDVEVRSNWAIAQAQPLATIRTHSTIEPIRYLTF